VSSSYLESLRGVDFSVLGRVASELRLGRVLSGSREMRDSPTWNSLGLKTIDSRGRVLNARREADLRMRCYFIVDQASVILNLYFKLNLPPISVKSINPNSNHK
jgi:hypothetical protein